MVGPGAITPAAGTPPALDCLVTSPALGGAGDDADGFLADGGFGARLARTGFSCGYKSRLDAGRNGRVKTNCRWDRFAFITDGLICTSSWFAVCLLKDGINEESSLQT
jgi:hypothetical protein